jgi:mRNA interferase RelE/StbE
MKVLTTRSFDRDYAALPDNIQDLANQKLRLLLENPRHPSLRLKKMGGRGEIWEASVTMTYRFTFQREGDTYILRRIGTHDILRTP